MNPTESDGGLFSARPESEYFLYGGNIMAFVITDECLSCGSCAAQCPAEAIEMGDLHYEIDQSKCLECGSCAAQCPAEAIENV
jgi:NAD-dependent dihydropyrimidine dehydrogenase PreA subunit